MAPLGDSTVLERALAALAATPGIGRVCVVGPETVRPLLHFGELWQEEGNSAVENLLRGLDCLTGEPARRVLLTGADVPALSPAGLDDFIRRTPPEAQVAMPVIRRQDFDRAFPGNRSRYVHLVEGAYTSGSQFLVRPESLRANLPLLRSLHARRKSQVAMAHTLGFGFVGRLLLRRVTVPQLEERLSRLSGFTCRAVLDCAPELAFDVDSWEDLEYFRTQVVLRASSHSTGSASSPRE